MSLILDLIQLVAVIILFIVTIKQKKALQDRDREIQALDTQLDTLKMEQSRFEFKLTEEQLKINTQVLSILNKIQRNYAISKTDKLKLISLLINMMRNIDISLLNKIDISKQYTYKVATEQIKEFINNPSYTVDQVVETLNALYYLITK